MYKNATKHGAMLRRKEKKKEKREEKTNTCLIRSLPVCECRPPAPVRWSPPPSLPACLPPCREKRVVFGMSSVIKRALQTFTLTAKAPPSLPLSLTPSLPLPLCWVTLSLSACLDDGNTKCRQGVSKDARLGRGKSWWGGGGWGGVQGLKMES